MPDVNLDELESLTRGVPKPYAGSWKVQPWRSGPAVVATGDFGPVVAQNVNAGERVAVYLSAVDPPTVLALIEEVRALRGQVSLLAAVGEAFAELNEDPR